MGEHTYTDRCAWRYIGINSDKQSNTQVSSTFFLMNGGKYISKTPYCSSKLLINFSESEKDWQNCRKWRSGRGKKSSSQHWDTVWGIILIFNTFFFFTQFLMIGELLIHD